MTEAAPTAVQERDLVQEGVPEQLCATGQPLDQSADRRDTLKRIPSTTN